MNLSSSWLPCSQCELKTQVGCYMHNMNLNSSWLPSVQCELELWLVALCTKHKLSKHLFWVEFEGNENLTIINNHSLTPKEKRNAISYIQIAFLLKFIFSIPVT